MDCDNLVLMRTCSRQMLPLKENTASALPNASCISGKQRTPYENSHSPHCTNGNCEHLATREILIPQPRRRRVKWVLCGVRSHVCTQIAAWQLVPYSLLSNVIREQDHAVRCYVQISHWTSCASPCLCSNSSPLTSSRTARIRTPLLRWRSSPL